MKEKNKKKYRVVRIGFRQYVISNTPYIFDSYFVAKGFLKANFK